MTAPAAPFDKQLVDLDLSKGMDERTRPELMGGITSIINMVQDQTGAWVKRPGTVLGPVSDSSGTGAAPVVPKKVMALVNGWAAIGDKGLLLHKFDTQELLRPHQSHMELGVVEAGYSGSSGLNSQGSGNNTSSIVAIASTTVYDAHIVAAGTAAGPGILVIRERATGVEVSYNLNTGLVATSAGTEVFMVSVGDRYFHIFTTDAFGGASVYVTAIDTQAMPVNITVLGALTTLVRTLPGPGIMDLRDAVGGTTRSWVLFGDGPGGDAFVYAQGVTGANIDHFDFPVGHAYDAMDADETSTFLWFMVGGATTRFIAQDTADSTLNNVATFITGYPGTHISCNTSNGDVLISYTTTKTFGGTTLAAIEALTLAAGTTTITVTGICLGWTPVSRPFYMLGSNKHYMHAVKFDAAVATTGALTAHVMMDLSSFTGLITNSAGLALPYGNFRVACVLEPFSGLQNMLTWDKLRIKPVNSGYECYACVAYQVSQRVTGTTFHKLRLYDSTAYGNANFSGATYFAHGGLNVYDGRNVTENGLVDVPIINNQVQAAVGNLNGSYRYVAVYRKVDANGTASYSRTYGPVAATNVAGATGQNLLTIQPLGVSNSNVAENAPFVELYRTATGGTQYYLVASGQTNMTSSSTPLVQQIAYNTTTGLMTVTDNLSDANLILQAVMYRQPGTANAPADRYPAPDCRYVVQHKDRLFCTDPYGQRVYYSSFFVDGEAAWFNPAFNFFVHAGSGPITGLASMDGRLFVFKRDVIFVVDGDGPGEAGPSGNEFSPPQALSSRFGCVDHRSIVATPEGIIYRSSRGIEQITRNLKVTWIGERVQNTVNDNPVTTGACLGPDSRVHILVSATETYTGVGTSTGVELIYDMSADAWSVAKYTAGEVYGRGLQNVAVVMNDGVESIVYAESLSGVRIASDATGLDPYSAYVPWTVETGWIKQGPQARQRISGLLALCKKRSGANHAIRISLAYNYVDSYTQTLTWEPSVLNSLTIEELCLKPTTQLVLAIRLKIEEIIPTDTATYPVGTGLGAELLGLTAEATPVHNAPFANRGVVGTITLPPAIAGISPATGPAAGGTAVTIYGTGFTAGTTFTLGGVALTSVVYVSANQMTAVTPAGTAGAASLIATNAGGTTAPWAGWTYSGAAIFDPATLNLSGWWRADYSASPWVANASAGISLTQGNLTEGVNPPVVGPALNAKIPAGFGLNAGVAAAQITNANDWSTFVTSATAYSVAVLVNPAVTADVRSVGAGYNDPVILGETVNGYWYMTYTTTGITMGHYDSVTGVWMEVNAACSAHEWHLVQGWFDGVNMSLSVDSAAAVTLASTNALPPVGGVLQVGKGFGGSQYFQGLIADVMVSPVDLGAPARANIRSYINDTYGLSV